jgi:Kef-type K+ transport system membrane component KefB
MLAATDDGQMANLGGDVLVFLAASVFVVPASRYLKITPVLGFLALGATIGPHGLGLIANSEADLELGDFGILFLLFAEGLNLSPERIKSLGSFFSLGAAQLLISIGVFFFGTLLGGPLILPAVEQLVPLDDALVRPILERPVEAFCIAAAGALSSSAFVLPVLKEKGWEEKPDGTAALSILLLQDLAVAPLLVLLPIAAGSGPQDAQALGLLVAKATFGFGGVLALGSVLLRRVFQLVASSQSTESFVAATLLVALGMGAAAQALGLSSTTGAFAAGVLLAGSRFRAQIEADIKPFEGILLGVFFLTAGATLDPAVCLQEWPTLLTGIVAFLGVKFSVLFVAGELALGLTRAAAARVALLLAGGGEFAFVVFKLAQDLGVLPENLAKLLVASVVISMSLTPLLGELAEYIGNELEALEGADAARRLGPGGTPPDAAFDPSRSMQERAAAAFAYFDTDGSGAISVDELKNSMPVTLTDQYLSDAALQKLIDQFDENGDGELQIEE